MPLLLIFYLLKYEKYLLDYIIQDINLFMKKYRSEILLYAQVEKMKVD